MVGFNLGNSGKNVSEEYLAKRVEAVHTTYTLREWGDIDITKYDLDELEFTGKDVDSNYVFKHPVSDDEVDVAGFDVRDLPTHD
jgi:hypothetical protein